MSFFRYIATDFELDTEGDILIQNGDFVVSPSDQRHIEDIICADKGNFRFCSSFRCWHFTLYKFTI